MRKKCNILALCSFAVAIVIFILTYFIFHYMSADGCFVTQFQEEAGKPFVTLLFGIFGVLFLFGGCMSLLIGRIFFDKE